MNGPVAEDAVRHAGSTQMKHRHATDAQNATAVAAGAAALGAVIGLAVSSATIAPIAGAVVAGVIGAAGGRQANNVVRWWRGPSRGIPSENSSTH